VQNSSAETARGHDGRRCHHIVTAITQRQARAAVCTPAVGTTIALIKANRVVVPKRPLTLRKHGRGKTKMNSDYMFLCGVMWCRFGQKEAGKELLRAATSMDPDMRALARAMLATGALRLRSLEGKAQRNPGTIPGGTSCG
jgi:hypothetical protein